MDKSLCFFVCETLYPEVDHVLRSGNYTGVIALKIPVKCSGPFLTDEHLQALAAKSPELFGKGIIIGSSCIRHSTSFPIENRNISFVKVDHCLDILAPPSLINQLFREQAYIISNGWFYNFRSNLDQWGFDRDTARKFFGESTKKLIMLNTGIPMEFREKLEEMSDFMGLPFEIINIGMDYCNLFIKDLILDWQKGQESLSFKSELARDLKRSADYAVVFHEINNLMLLTEESSIIMHLFKVLNALCAPGNIVYNPVSGGVCQPQVWFRDQRAEGNPDVKTGFTIELYHDAEIGSVTLSGIAFPEYLDHYIELSQMIGKICSLAIDNARKFKAILENENYSVEQAKKLKELNAMKDKFFSIIGHDLRSPLSTILGFLELLSNAEADFSPGAREKVFQKMSSLVRKTYELLENLLEWARLQTQGNEINPSVFNLAKIVRETVDLIRPSAEAKDIEIGNLLTGPMQVFADKDSVRSVLRNLITNAVKFTNVNGNIEISAKAEQNFAWIYVKDNGVGISDSSLPKLFRIDSGFSTAGTAKEKGTGLGLILCRELIERNKGSIGVESKQEQGSTFWFTLPLAVMLMDDPR
ncbi:MAG: HAMP domain-containing sensor histidine kinase [Bacteroidetes bacterium]|nr:HAMP domain-containing sensor histidine kinase [Bacteroidota bacterium]